MRWAGNGQTNLERALLSAMFAVRLDVPSRLLNRRRPVLAMYHGFTDRMAHEGIANHEWKHLPAAEFRRQSTFLVRRYNVVRLEDLVRASTTGTPLPPSCSHRRTGVVRRTRQAKRSVLRRKHPAHRKRVHVHLDQRARALQPILAKTR